MMLSPTRLNLPEHTREFLPALFQSIRKVSDWLEENDYSGYDTFDGLNSRLLRPFAFNNKFLQIALQQSVRRSLFNVRPVLGIRKSRSTKAMGFVARGFIRLYQATGDASWRDQA